MTTATPIVCRHNHFKVIDRHGTSMTTRCLDCGHCALVVELSGIRRVIPLTDFHLKRGDGPDQRPVDDLSMATRLVRCLVMDQWPSHGTIVDYGIDSGAHLGALQFAVGSGITAYDLDRVMGDGPALTQLVLAVPQQPYSRIRFSTLYDGFAELLACKA